MNGKSLSEILSMSGYAGYVWGAFSMTLLMLILLYAFSRIRLKKALAEEQRLAGDLNSADVKSPNKVK